MVGTVGRMQQVKDQATLARAFVLALQQAPELRARLRLDDTVIEELSLVQRNGLSTLVRWRERVAAP